MSDDEVKQLRGRVAELEKEVAALNEREEENISKLKKEKEGS
jgi:hypothetical protein